MKTRWDSLNCLSKFDCSYINDRNPLHSALNVELQRANSRMILERTPGLDGLIDSAMVKCEQSVAKKRDDAIDTLQLSRLRPARVHEEIKIEENRLELDPRAGVKEPTIQENDYSQGKPLWKKEEREQSQREEDKTYGRKRQLEKIKEPDPPWCKGKPPEKVNYESHGSG